MGLEPFLLRLVIDRLASAEHAIAELRTRVAVLESAPVVRYAGVGRAGRKFAAGAATTHDGCLWIAERETVDERPGNGATGWRLAVKSGNGAHPPASRFPTMPRRNGLGR